MEHGQRENGRASQHIQSSEFLDQEEIEQQGDGWAFRHTQTSESSVQEIHDQQGDDRASQYTQSSESLVQEWDEQQGDEWASQYARSTPARSQSVEDDDALQYLGFRSLDGQAPSAQRDHSPSPPRVSPANTQSHIHRIYNWIRSFFWKILNGILDCLRAFFGPRVLYITSSATALLVFTAIAVFIFPSITSQGDFDKHSLFSHGNI